MSDSPPRETEVTQDTVVSAGDTSSPRFPPGDAAEEDQKAASGSPQLVSEAKADPAPVEKEETQEDIR